MRRTKKEIYDFVAKKLEEAKAQRFRQPFTSRKSGELGAKVEAYEEVLNFISAEPKVVGTTTVSKALEKVLIDNCPEVKKKLKALEIIKKHNIVVSSLLEMEDADEYNTAWSVDQKNEITQEEFDLVKEVFK